MNEYQKNNNCDVKSTSRPVMSRPSLFQTLAEVKKQVEYDCFGKTLKKTGKVFIDPLYEEICLIIAEVLVRPPESTMRIRGNMIETGIVQEVYRALTNEHVQMVYENFVAQEHHVYKKSAYLQTALYNAVFELSANDMNGGLC